MLTLVLLAAAASEASSARDLRKAAGAALARGEYRAAQQAAEKALALDAKSADEVAQSDDYGTLGLALVYQGHYADALRNYEAALAIDRRRNLAEREVMDLYNIGNAHVYQGKYQEAFRRYQESIQRLDASRGQPWEPRHRRIALANLANLYQRLGRYERALDFYTELRRSLDVLSPSERARLLANLGTLYRRLGDPRKALETYREAQRGFAAERHREGEISVLKNVGIVLALDFARLPDALVSFERALRLATESSSAQAASCELYAGEALWRMGRDADARKNYEAARSGAPEYAWRALYGLGRIAQRAGDTRGALRHFEQAIARIESVRSELDLLTLKREFLADKREVYDSAIELLIGEPHPPADQIFRLMEQSRGRVIQDSSQRPTLDVIRRALPEKSALLEYWVGTGRAAVLVVTRAGAELAVRPAVTAAGWRSRPAGLSETLLGGLPLFSDPNIRNLLIVPDGSLQLVPFEALPLPDSKQLLVERYSTVYLPAASVLTRPGRSRAALVFPWQSRLLAFADPDVPAASPLDTPWERLPKAREEAAAVSRLAGGRARIHTGSEARKERLQSLPIVHLSTHAAADTADPERSRILFAGDPLFLREIYALDFRSTDLVVLSACETDTGKLVPGEGIEGFSRAFLTAGAGATVTTLWRVEDSAAAEFMKQFYAGMASGNPAAEALRAAKLAFLRSHTPLADPRHWAAFVLSGDGFSPMPRAVRWWMMVAPLAAAVAGIAFIARRALRRPGWQRRQCGS